MQNEIWYIFIDENRKYHVRSCNFEFHMNPGKPTSLENQKKEVDAIGKMFEKEIGAKLIRILQSI